MGRRYIPYRRALGQHFLRDEHVIERMVQLADLNPGEVVLEVGAGQGALTSHLARKVAKVLAVEKDPALAAALRERFAGNPKVELFCGDILHLDLPRYDKIVSSLPYSISLRFFLWLLSQDFMLATLLVQREFAQKLTAAPGSLHYSRITVLAGHKFKIKVLDQVAPGSFTPPPRVVSNIVCAAHRAVDSGVDDTFFREFVTALFSQRRKGLKTAVTRFMRQKLEKRGLGDGLLRIPQKRVYEASVEEFEMLADTLLQWTQDS